MKIENIDKINTVAGFLAVLDKSINLIAHRLCYGEGAIRKWIKNDTIPERAKRLIASIYEIDIDDLKRF